MINLHASTSASQTGASSSAQNRKQKKEFDHRLEIICKSSPAILQTAIDSFVRAPKGSEAAVREAAKVELALTHGSDPNQSASPVLTNLSKAIAHNRPWLFKKLLNHPKTDVNHASKGGWPPIFHAIRAGNLPAFLQLMKKDAKVSSETATWAAWCGREEMLDAILAKVPESEISPETREDLTNDALVQPFTMNLLERQSPAERGAWLQEALSSLEYTKVERLSAITSVLLVGVDTNTRYQDGNRPLHLAAARFINEPMPIRMLLNEGANPDSQNDDGDTPTSIAVQNNNIPALKALLDAGANPNLGNKDGDTPLAIAALNNNIEAIDALLAAGADPHPAKP